MPLTQELEITVDREALSGSIAGALREMADKLDPDSVGAALGWQNLSNRYLNALRDIQTRLTQALRYGEAEHLRAQIQVAIKEAQRAQQ